MYQSRNKQRKVKDISHTMQRGPKVLLCPLLATSEDKALEQDSKRDPKARSDPPSPELQAVRTVFGGSIPIL